MTPSPDGTTRTTRRQLSAVIQPDLLTSKEVAVDVITSGPAYGQTVAYTRNAPEDAVPVELLYDVDFDAFMDLFIELMTK